MISNLRQLNLNLLLVFDALMQEQNLSRAAERLHMSQSAVSNALARLREQLDEPLLFKRTSKGLVPTAQAHTLYEPVRQALHLLQVGLGPRDQFDLSSTHIFKMGMNDVAQAYTLPLLMTKLNSVAPQVMLSVLDVEAEAIATKLATGALDLAIDYLYFDNPDLRYEPLIEQRVLVIGRKGHPAFDGGLTLDSFQQSRHVSIQPRAGRGSPLEIVLGSAKARRDVQLYLPNYLAIPAIVAQTDMLGVVPMLMAHQFAPTYALETAPLPMDAPGVQISLIWHRHQDNAPGLLWLKEQILSLVPPFMREAATH